MSARPAAARPPATVASAASITRRASFQSYLTIRLLADRAYRADAFALYAWFRWLDDQVDEHLPDAGARLAFVARERRLLAAAAGFDDAVLDDYRLDDYRLDHFRLDHFRPVDDIAPEERFLLHLAGRIRRDPNGADGLRRSLIAMLDVMDRDARRRGEPVPRAELDAYTEDLAVAVTEALHHCIGHGRHSPADGTRYVAVTGAHVAHMLRDTVEDLAAGYVNVPAEVLPDVGPLGPADVHGPAMRAWVRERVGLARACFATGRGYLARVECRRCRLAGHAYIARFEWVLDAIERDGYRLRPAYPERATLRGGLRIAADAARSARAARRNARAARITRTARAARTTRTARAARTTRTAREVTR